MKKLCCRASAPKTRLQFQDLVLQRGPTRVARSRNAAMLWRRIQSGEAVPPERAGSASTIGGAYVLAHAGSSIGNVRLHTLFCLRHKNLMLYTS
jgi:hypothetical protein